MRLRLCTSTIARLACVWLLVLAAQSAVSQEHRLTGIATRLILAMDFSELADGLAGDEFSFIGPEAMTEALTSSQTGHSDIEVATLLRIMLDSQAMQRHEEYPLAVMTVARVLARFNDFSLDQVAVTRLTELWESRPESRTSLSVATRDVAHRIAIALIASRDGLISRGYESAALAVANAAYRVPSFDLAVSLADIAQYARDQSVVSSCRAATRAILETSG